MKSLNKLYFITFFLSITLSISFFSILVLTGIKNYTYENVKERNKLLINSLEDELVIFLKKHKTILELITFLHKEKLLNKKIINFILNKQKSIENIIILNKKGIVTHYFPNNQFVGFDFSNKTYFKNTKDFFISNSFLSPFTKEPTISISKKIKNGMIIININLSNLNNRIKKIKNYKGEYIASIVDKNRVFIANPKNPNLIYQRSVSYIPTQPFEITNGKVISSKTIDKIGWHLIISEPYQNTFRYYLVLKKYLILFIIFSIIISFFISILLVKKLQKPLNKIILNIKNIANGDYSQTITPPKYKELKEIYDNVIKMQNTIKDREIKLKTLNQNLENKVKSQVNEIIKKDRLLAQQSKLAAMGEMIGAIAHQWRQPLNALALNIQLLEDMVEDDECTEENISEFIENNMRTIMFMSKTIDDFRNFFKTDYKSEIFEIKQAIEETIYLLKAQLTNHNIELIIKGDEFKIQGIKNEFKQVILNIINNAKEEMSNGGKIEIEIKNKKIFIRNNGKQIDKELLDRIFEPYFTTKDTGTGIGLYMSKIIIENHMKGKLSVHNINNGVEFIIDFSETT